MDIFVWKSYGNIQVYAMETSEQYVKLINDIILCLDDWGLESLIDKVNKHMQSYSDVKQLRRCVNTLLTEIGVGTHESFEFGTGFSELKE